MNTIRINIIIGILIWTITSLGAQSISLDGFIKDAAQKNKIKNVTITVFDVNGNIARAVTYSDQDGKFSLNLIEGNKYRLVAEKKSYFSVSEEIEVHSDAETVEMNMERKPGYVFDVSLINADFKRGKTELDAVKDARIEIYNNTTRTEELALTDHPQSSFIFNFEEGNHYTIMVRKKGYLTKRIEAYINVDGCILCFDGLGIVEPNVVDVMAQNNQLGAFLANLEMEPIAINTTFRIENLYYDYDQYNIRTDAALVLDNVVQVLKDNPSIKVEMGSHTDSRGSDSYNLELSDKRAKSSMDYLVANGVDANNLTWKGYGETRLVNSCSNRRTCSEEMHQQNRRTELKITGIEYENPMDKKSLKQIIEAEGYYSGDLFSYGSFGK